MSLRASINWLITLVMLLFIVALVALQIEGSRRSAAAEMEAATRVTVQLLTSLIDNDTLQQDDGAPRALAGYLEQAGRIRAHDIEVLDSAGRTLHRSPPSPWKAGRYAPAWFTHLVAPPISTITLPVGSGQVRIAPDSSRMVLDAWDELLTVFWLSLLLFTLLNLLVFWFAGRAVKENQAWLQLIDRHIEEERRKLAHELHDEIGQSLTAVRTLATTLVSRGRERDPALTDTARMIVDISTQMYDAMHGMVRQLRPLVLDRLGLHAALQELVESQQARFPDIHFTFEPHGDLARVAPEVAIVAYRMVQESLTNVVRHAHATQARVRVQVEERLSLCVEDDGRGPRIDPNDRDEHYGLIGMRERAESLGGSFQWQADAGMRVTVQLPLQDRRKRQ
ncbi:MAG TPA: sensor histidine kinase [Hyphomicrobiales bacterium]|nr:sensor histidine kinase [Hyphomicrobiales bacterium]